MAWQYDMVQMLRVLINDVSSPQKYTTLRLMQILTVAANYVQNEISLPQKYTINLPETISPDPTLLSTPDVDFISFTVLKAACLIDKSLATNAALSGNLSAKAGESKLSLKSKIKNYKELVRIGNCSKYEKMKAEYAYHSLENALSVMTPFVDIISDDFKESVVTTPDPVEPEPDPDIAGDFTLTVSPNLVINERSEVVFDDDLATITFSDSRDTFSGTVNWGDGNIESLNLQKRGNTIYASGSHTYATNGAYIVTITVTDDDGGTKTKAFVISVLNIDVPGDFILTVYNNVTIDENELLDLTGGLLGSFIYSIPTDTHTATVDWGDGTVENAVIVEADGEGTISGSHNYGYITYADSGFRIVTVTLEDSEGGTDSKSFVVTITNKDIPFEPLTYDTESMLNIEKYGAAEEENITAILQFALENTSHNGTVYIPSKTYYITDTIVINGYGGGIYGAGANAKLVWAGNTGKPMFKILGSGFFIAGNLTLTGQNSGIDDSICKTAIEIDANGVTSCIDLGELTIEKFDNGIDIINTYAGVVLINTLTFDDVVNGILIRDNSSLRATLLEIYEDVENVVILEDTSMVNIEGIMVYHPTVIVKIPTEAVENSKPMFSVDDVQIFAESNTVRACEVISLTCYPHLMFNGLNVDYNDYFEDNQYLFDISGNTALIIEDSNNIQKYMVKIRDTASNPVIFLERTGLGVLSSMAELIYPASTSDYFLTVVDCYNNETLVPIEDYKNT